MKLLIIRHGQSSNNLLQETTGSYEGRHPDPALTELGEQQAHFLADAMVAGLQPRPDVLFTSLMSRAVQTAGVIAEALDLELFGHLEAYECGGPYIGNPGNPQPYPGSPASKLLELCPRLQLPEEASEDGWYYGQDEDEPARAARGARVIADIKEKYLGQDIIVGLVCHEMIAQYLIRAALDYPAPQSIPEPWLSLNNTGTCFINLESPVPITETIHNGSNVERVLEWLNNYSHLPSREPTN